MLWRSDADGQTIGNMNALRPTSGDGEQLVTASELVRNFGAWQDRALRAPVYVLHRGRPRLVLTSLELMNALCAPHSAASGASGGDWLEVTREIIVLTDAEGLATGASRAARGYFGSTLTIGAPVARVAAETAPLLASAIQRVAASGVAETLDCTTLARPGRRLAIAIEPFGGGVALIGRDETADEERHALQIEVSAAAAAIGALPGVAEARINLRGYCEAPGDALARMTGVPPATLAAARFVTLFAVGDRVRIGEAIEQVIAGGEAQALDAALLVNRGNPLAVQLGLAPRRSGAAVQGVQALIVAAG